MISANPDHGELRQRLSGLNNIPVEKPRRGTTCIFSPQVSNDGLTWYAKQATVAENALFMTFAFGMNDVFKEAYRSGHSALRYALMEDLLAPGVRKENKPAALEEMKTLRQMPENRFAVGNRIATNHFDRWIKEHLTGLNQHVQFIHTKFMLVDPLSDDPIVITGSANFSAASTTKNDENMLIIRGNRRVADVYLGEYMRLWNHYAFREWLAAKGDSIDEGFKHLDTENKWWRGYFGNTVRSRQRQYFSGASS